MKAAATATLMYHVEDFDSSTPGRRRIVGSPGIDCTGTSRRHGFNNVQGDTGCG
jgi:hypothetical protein